MKSLPAGDFRQADYRLLLPAGEGLRLTTGPGLPEDAVRALDAHFPATADARYDVAVATAEAGLPLPALRPGGVLCRLGDPAPRAPGPDWVETGRWLAVPGLPAFRVLVPDTVTGRRAAAMLGVSPSTAGLHIAVRRGEAPRTSLLSLALDALDLPSPPGGVAIVSGRLGEGNPVLAFLLDADGRPRHVVKVARFAGQTHLEAEHESLQAIVRTLGPELSSCVVSPTAHAVVDGHPALAFAYEPSAPLHGWRWRLGRRARYLRRASTWLAEVARRTTHTTNTGHFDELHVAPLRRLAASGVLPEAWDARVKKALCEVEGLRARAVLVLEHGDLGPYNTRLVDPRHGDFKVLDWGSAQPDGLPAVDLGYLLSTTGASPVGGARLLGEYLDAIKQPRPLFEAFALSYVARRFEELERVRGRQTGDALPGGRLLLPVARRMLAFAEHLT